MALRARARLVLAALWLLLALLPWPAQAGTAEAPEITDPAGDQELLVVPVDPAGFASADLVAGWITETADALLFHIQVAGTGIDGAAGPYSWTFHATGDAAVEMSATSSADQPTPGGAATAAALADSVITLTVPRTAFGAATALSGLYIEARGGTPAQGQGAAAVADTAPDDGADAGVGYTITGGGSSGSPGDADGDGLNDTREVEAFGNLTAQDGTGDPDADGLNNTAEFAAGTDPNKADTDGDGVPDGQDEAPLDPTRPADGDGDGLTDSWERTHFNATSAQSGGGDPDQDTLNNTQELALGTDPNKADTDGDGASDADDPDPLDPASSGDGAADGERRPELYLGAVLFAAAATFILLGLAKGI